MCCKLRVHALLQGPIGRARSSEAESGCSKPFRAGEAEFRAGEQPDPTRILTGAGAGVSLEV